MAKVPAKDNPLKSRGGLGRVLKAAGYSLQGFKHALKHEAAFRQELALVLVLVPLAAWLAVNRWEFIALVAPLFLVLLVELLNSAIEALADEISIERRDLLGRAKDLGSAAVFVALALTILVWFVVLWPRV
jgi:diacylglycerol kinase (ATP)